MKQKIGVIVPFRGKEQGIINKRAIAIALFAKRIIEKYSALGLYGFDDAAMVFLEKLVEDEKQGNEIKKQIEFTVKLMLLHQNRNRLSKDIISENNAFQRNITNHIMVNLNRLLTVDKRVYRELNQISHNNVKLQEAYDKIVRLENYEKKLVFQIHNQQTIRPNTLKNSFYKMFNRLLKQNQVKLSTQLFKESVEREQFKQNLNRLLELQTFRSDVERHEFLHVMQHGTLEERREAMELLKQAVMEVNTTFIKKEDKRAWFSEFISNSFEHVVQENYWYPKFYRRNIWNQLRKGDSVEEQSNDSGFEHRIEMIYQKQSSQVKEEVQLQIAKNTAQERELSHMKQVLKRQQIMQENEHKVFEEIKSKVEKQEKIVNQLIKEQGIWQQEASPRNISTIIQKQIKSELHLDRMRYGME